MIRLFDDEKAGFITIKNLRRVTKELGGTMTDEELLEMVERADSDGDRRVTPEDFCHIMTQKVFPRVVRHVS